MALCEYECMILSHNVSKILTAREKFTGRGGAKKCVNQLICK